MKTSISMSSVKISTEDHMRRIAEANFEAIVYSLAGNTVPWEEGFFTDPFCPEFAEYFQNVARTAADLGLTISHTHGPFCSPQQCEAKAYETVLKQTIQAVYATSYMKCPYIVAHPVMHPDFNQGQNLEQGIQANLQYFSALVPVLKETGVIMCIENLFWGLGGRPKFANACSDAKQLIEVIDTLNDTYGPYFAACLDTGHAVVAGQDPIEMLRLLGDRTRTLHLHETWGSLDDHLFPGVTGKLNWHDFCKTLAEIGYQGEFNFEVIFYPKNKFVDTDCYEAYYDATLKMLASVARSMVNLIEQAP